MQNKETHPCEGCIFATRTPINYNNASWQTLPEFFHFLRQASIDFVPGCFLLGGPVKDPAKECPLPKPFPDDIV